MREWDSGTWDSHAPSPVGCNSIECVSFLSLFSFFCVCVCVCSGFQNNMCEEIILKKRGRGGTKGVWAFNNGMEFVGGERRRGREERKRDE